MTSIEDYTKNMEDQVFEDEQNLMEHLAGMNSHIKAGDPEGFVRMLRELQEKGVVAPAPTYSELGMTAHAPKPNFTYKPSAPLEPSAPPKEAVDSKYAADLGVAGTTLESMVTAEIAAANIDAAPLTEQEIAEVKAPEAKAPESKKAKKAKKARQQELAATKKAAVEVVDADADPRFRELAKKERKFKKLLGEIAQLEKVPRAEQTDDQRTKMARKTEAYAALCEIDESRQKIAAAAEKKMRKRRPEAELVKLDDDEHRQKLINELLADEKPTVQKTKAPTKAKPAKSVWSKPAETAKADSSDDDADACLSRMASRKQKATVKATPTPITKSIPSEMTPAEAVDMEQMVEDGWAVKKTPPRVPRQDKQRPVHDQCAEHGVKGYFKGIAPGKNFGFITSHDSRLTKADIFVPTHSGGPGARGRMVDHLSRGNVVFDVVNGRRGQEARNIRLCD